MNKFYNTLGMAMRAGKLITGEETVIDSVRKGEAKLVIIAEDAAVNTLKKVSDKCNTFGVNVVHFGSRERLGASIGKESRVTIAVADSGFAKMLRKSLENRTEVEGIE